MGHINNKAVLKHLLVRIRICLHCSGFVTVSASVTSRSVIKISRWLYKKC